MVRGNLSKFDHDSLFPRTSFAFNGNRTSDTITSGNRMASDGTYNYTYDANGNCVSRTTISPVSSSQYITLYTWDYRNRLVEVQYETSAGQLTETINYSYDYLNRRIEKITFPSGGAADHSYLAYQGNQPYAQFDSGTAAITHSAAAGDETDWYMQAATVDQVLSDYQPDSYGETLWLLPDNQGTIRDLAADMNFGTQSTFVIIHRNFDAFGNITSVQCNITFPFTITTAIGYCGGIYDPDLNMVQFVDRWYDPAAGRWLTPDPRGFAGGLSNLYCYCGNNPLNERDPTGQCGYSGSGIVSTPGTGSLNLTAGSGTIFPGTVSSPGLTSIITGEPLPSMTGGGISPSTPQEAHLAAIAQSEAFSEDTGGDMVVVPGAAPLTINSPSYPASVSAATGTNTPTSSVPIKILSPNSFPPSPATDESQMEAVSKQLMSDFADETDILKGQRTSASNMVWGGNQAKVIELSASAGNSPTYDQLSNTANQVLKMYGGDATSALGAVKDIRDNGTDNEMLAALDHYFNAYASVQSSPAPLEGLMAIKVLVWNAGYSAMKGLGIPVPQDTARPPSPVTVFQWMAGNYGGSLH